MTRITQPRRCTQIHWSEGHLELKAHAIPFSLSLGGLALGSPCKSSGRVTRAPLRLFSALLSRAS